MNSPIPLKRISIGVLAYNSVGTIESTIRCLAEQDLISELHSDCTVEILILPNGCTDTTAELSTNTLDDINFPSHVSYRVCSIAEKGKCNAWNEFVHNYSARDSDILIFMDSDINFLGAETLTNLAAAVHLDSKARIAVDEPVKDVALKSNRTWWEWLSLQVSDVGRKTSPSICGQLYAGKTEFLREIWMPESLPVEDGFLRAMILTNGFQEPEDFSRIVKAKNASHRFEAHLGTKNLLSHEEWLVAASTINTFVYDYLWKQCKQDGRAAGELIRERNQADPNWLAKMVAKETANKAWIVPSKFVFRRFYQIKQFLPFKAIIKAPIALIAFFVDCIICYRVNRTIKSNNGIGYWRTEEEQNDGTTESDGLGNGAEVNQLNVPGGGVGNKKVHVS